MLKALPERDVHALQRVMEAVEREVDALPEGVAREYLLGCEFAMSERFGLRPSRPTPDRRRWTREGSSRFAPTH